MALDTQDKIMIFIDGSNLFHSANDIGIKIDYEKLKEILTSERKLIRPYIFVSVKEPPVQKQTNFYNKLRYIGYEVVETELQKEEGKFYEKGVDIALATKLLLCGHKKMYDVAVVATGDKDFLPAIQAVKEMGKQVEVAGFDHSTAKTLQLNADKYISLDGEIEKLKR